MSSAHTPNPPPHPPSLTPPELGNASYDHTWGRYSSIWPLRWDFQFLSLRFLVIALCCREHCMGACLVNLVEMHVTRNCLLQCIIAGLRFGGRLLPHGIKTTNSFKMEIFIKATWGACIEREKYKFVQFYPIFLEL